MLIWFYSRSATTTTEARHSDRVIMNEEGVRLCWILFNPYCNVILPTPTPKKRHETIISPWFTFLVAWNNSTSSNSITTSTQLTTIFWTLGHQCVPTKPPPYHRYYHRPLPNLILILTPTLLSPPAFRQQPLSSPAGTYTPKVSFDTFENPAASMFSFTLQVKIEGSRRTRHTRVFLCASSPDKSGREALEWRLESLVQEGDELIVFRGVDEDVLGDLFLLFYSLSSLIASFE